MDQRKMGEFLKRLRREKGLTQEQLAEKFYVSSRTVSRWETGSNLPDVATLVELADFYDVDIREIIDGERKSEMMDKETKETLKKVAVYADQKEKRAISKTAQIALAVVLILAACFALFWPDVGLLYGTVPEAVCRNICIIAEILGGGFLVFYIRICWALERPTKEPEKTVSATVVSKEVRSGTHRTGRSTMGYSFVITFRTQEGEEMELYAYDVEFGGMKEGMTGELTYKGRYFVSFQEPK